MNVKLMNDQSKINKIQVSIVMTIYNAEAYLRDAISSIVNQTLPNWELIAIENGSTDKSLQILKEFKDIRIHQIKLPKNIGRTAALNFGCRQSVGKYVAILDADDLADPERLRIQTQFLDQNMEVGIVATWANIINQSGITTAYLKPPTYPKPLNENLSWSMPIVHSTMMIRRSILLDEFDGYSIMYDIGQDWDLCVQVAKKYPVYVINNILGSWRRYQTSLTGSTANFLKGRMETLKILVDAKSLCKSKESSAKNRKMVAINALAVSYYLLLNLKFIDAIKYMHLALSTDKLCLFNNRKIKSLFVVTDLEYFESVKP